MQSWSFATRTEGAPPGSASEAMCLCAGTCRALHSVRGQVVETALTRGARLRPSAVAVLRKNVNQQDGMLYCGGGGISLLRGGGHDAVISQASCARTTHLGAKIFDRACIRQVGK